MNVYLWLKFVLRLIRVCQRCFKCSTSKMIMFQLQEANFQCFWGSRSKKMIFKLQSLVFNVPGARTQKWRFSTIRNFFILSERWLGAFQHLCGSSSKAMMFELSRLIFDASGAQAQKLWFASSLRLEISCRFIFSKCRTNQSKSILLFFVFLLSWSWMIFYRRRLMDIDNLDMLIICLDLFSI